MSSSLGGSSGLRRTGATGARFIIPSKMTPEVSPRKGREHVALGMRRIQRVRDIDCEGEQEVEFEGTAADPMLQRLAFKVLHNDEGSPILVSDIVDGTDVRMVET